MNSPKVYILVLNYNGWHHTLECLESLLKLEYSNFQIVVIDNDSSDGSVGYLRSWAEGRLNVWVSDANPLKTLVFPTWDTMDYLYYERDEAEQGGTGVGARKGERAGMGAGTTGHPLVIIQSGRNLGFAGGNNVGIRYALSRGDADYVWLVNNDAVVRSDALTHLVERSRRKVRTGAVGSVHLDYQQPDVVQTAGGGRYRTLLGLTKNVLSHETYSDEFVERTGDGPAIDFVSGCSMLMTREALQSVGLLDEAYFVYWEDADWCERAKRQGFSLACSVRSVVYHKVSQSSSLSVSAYFSTLNCFRLYRKYRPSLLPLVLLSRIVIAVMIGFKHRSPAFVTGALRAYKSYLTDGLRQNSSPC